MTRLKLLHALAFIPLLAIAQDTKRPADPPKVVFVCEHGSAKSVIAAAHLERLAKEQGLQLQVIARGTVPDAEVGAPVRNGLKADGIQLGGMKPTAITAEDLIGATKVISF